LGKGVDGAQKQEDLEMNASSGARRTPTTAGRQRRWRIPAVAALVTAAFTMSPVVPIPGAAAVAINGASFSPTVAKSGAQLTLNVSTSNDTSCVEVFSVTTFIARQGLLTGTSTSWTFNFSAGTGNGPQIVTVTAFKNYNSSQNTCTGQSNSMTATYNLDNTAPSISVSSRTPANSNGWNNTDVTVTYSCSDQQVNGFASGLAAGACANNVVTAEGANQSVSRTVTDNVGNSNSITTSGINIDKTAPLTTASVNPTTNTAGWNRANAIVTLTPTDALSGVGASGTTYSVDNGATQTGTSVSITADGTHSISYHSTDLAGNVETSKTFTVKLDKTAPTITGSRTPGANANGWNNTDVTASFVCSDAGSLIKTCDPNITLSGNGLGQSATGTAVDNADNTSTATVSNINIDKIAPSLSGAPLTSPNGAGWYKGNVVVRWTCTDQVGLSGIDGLCPADSTITGEGSTLTTNASVNDKAANTANATSSPAVNIDRTAPQTTATAPPAWNNNDVTVDLTPSDSLSGIASTTYTLDGGASQSGTSVHVSAEGIHTLTYFSTDNAGNIESPKTLTIKIDKTPPTIGHTQSPAVNPNGWNNTSVTVTFTCADALSAIQSCTAPITIATEGANQAATGTAKDNANNTATDPAKVSIDLTAPTISASRSPVANNNGWNNEDVTVSFLCSDTLSGIAFAGCPQAVTRGEGANQSVTGTATDAAGNTKQASVAGINIDKTLPLLSGAPTTAAVQNGYYRGPVVIHWTCSDTLSGIPTGTCPADSVVSSNGEGLYASASVTDRAGNTTPADSAAVNIDQLAPTTTSDAPAGWQANTVTVHLSATDGGPSGVAATYYSLDGAPAVSGTSLSVGDGVHTLSFWSVDVAGNVEAGTPVTIQVDTQAPTISHTTTPASNGAGWNNTPVTVAFSCADQAGLSGVAGCSPVNHLLDHDGAAQVVAGTATDHAGNSTTDTAVVNIDQQPPTISYVLGSSSVKNANGWYQSEVTATFTCADQSGLSGVVECPTSHTFGEGANTGYSVSVFDNAGNSASVTVEPVSIDLTNPLLTGAPTTAPNGHDWYNGDVTVEWSCDDGVSGIDGGCPPNSVIGGEGEGLTDTASVNDRAGRTTASTTAPVRIDRHTPATTADAPTAWTNASTTVTLHATDGLSGVEHTSYMLDGGAEQSGTSILISDEGVHTLQFWSVDNAGNEEGHHSAQVRIDKSAPLISSSQDPVKNAAGWNNTAVTVSFTCTDQVDLSGIDSCTGPTTLSGEGASQPVDGIAVDNAGNGAATTAYVSIDATPPAITYSLSAAPNANGWYNAPLNAAFTCSDVLSGTTSCAPASVVFDEGAGQWATGAASDAAGNTATSTVSGIDVDLTAPAITGSPTGAPNGNGWYHGDVTVHWTCADPLSSIASCPIDSVVTGEGEALGVSATATDRADNSRLGTVGGIAIDRTPPVSTYNAPSGWQDHMVTVHPTANDSLSDVAHTYVSIDDGAAVVDGDATVSEGAHDVAYWSVDRADNTETAHHVTVLVDTTLPTVGVTHLPLANAAGWNNADVTVGFDCHDVPSGVASCSPPVTVTSDTAGETVTGTATDLAGNASSETDLVKLDKTKPTINASTDRDANSAGWYNADVVVSFACDDALSGIAACPPAATLAEGDNQSAGGTAIDNADNTAAASVTGINVDKTKPALTGSPQGSPNANGWYHGPVTVKWACSDALSGIDGSCPADTTLSTEGSGLTASESVSDRAGNTTSATSSPAVKIDTTEPLTVVSAPGGWSNHAVTLTLTPSDSGSGVAATYYSIDGAQAAVGTSATLSTEGEHTVTYWSVDKAGNEEAHSSALVLIDLTAPTITHSQSPLANLAKWNHGNVQVTFVCADSLSQINSCTPVQSVANDGANQSVIGVAHDKAGNSAQDEAIVSVDKTPPTINERPGREPANASGWYNTPVVIAWDCDDALSGLASCSAPVTVGNGVQQSVTGTASDVADNTASRTISGINVDTVAPSISGAPTTAANADGWYNGTVMVHWTCTDTSSGIALGTCPADSPITGEGANLSASASVADRAGNTSHATVSGIKIDRTPPSTTDDAPTGWSKTAVTVHLSATDSLSGVKTTFSKVNGGPAVAGASVIVSGDGPSTVVYWSIDRAGNAESQKSVTIRIDTKKPVITASVSPAANSYGWNNTPVTVTFSCADQSGLSGVASCPAPVTVTTDGANQRVSGTATDGAGNSSTLVVSPINIDTRRPQLEVAGLDDTDDEDGGLVFVLGRVPAMRCTAEDSGSGLVGPCTATLTGGNANGVGAFVYTARAMDKAGNVTVKSVSFRVRYKFDGFLQPINDTHHDGDRGDYTEGGTTAIFKAGSTVPVKFALRKGDGTAVQAVTAPSWLTPVKGAVLTACSRVNGVSDPASSGLTYRWDSSANQYIYNWNTDKTQAGAYWRIGVTLDDGFTYTVSIGLK
jgi:large repetitive protein